jgi:hypothetical protein
MMQKYEVQPDVEIHIDVVGGDLKIEGHAEAEIKAKGDDLTIIDAEDKGQRIDIHCGGDCRLSVPNGTRLEIETIGGDARITDVTGAIHIEDVGGDLTVRNAGPLSLGSIGGDLSVKRIKGNVEVETVGADAKFGTVAGSVHVETIGADALLVDIQGDCDIETVGSDVILDTVFVPGHHYHFSDVGVHVIARLQPDADVRFVVPAGVKKMIEISDARVEQTEDNDTVILGNGSAVVEVEQIGDKLRLVPQGAGNEDLIMDSDIHEEDLEEIIHESVREAERARERAERVAEKARRHAEREVERAERQAERHRREAERARRRAHGKSWGFTFSWPEKGIDVRVPPIPPIPPIPPMPNFHFGFGSGEKRKRDSEPAGRPADPVTNEERMAILRMVENKQITVEEAERLLSALEGND